MKKLIFAAFLLLVCKVGHADSKLAPVGPSTATILSASVNNSSVTIASPGGSLRNCLTDLQVTVNFNSTFTIKDGATSIYAIDLTTASVLLPAQSLPFDTHWSSTDPLCAGANSALYLIQSTGTAKVNYKGQIRGN